MDRVRLGRVLGKGARLAARTAMEVVDAASAPSPQPAQSRPSAQAGPSPQAQPRSSAQSEARSPGQAQSQPRTVTIEPPVRAPRSGSTEQPRRAEGVSFASTPLRPAIAAARASFTAPFRRASRALWHELTGSFFALFAFSFAVGLWHSRANALSSLPADRHRFYAFCALTLLFGYFAISSFVRAKRESR
jgi:hypothetical protein